MSSVPFSEGDTIVAAFADEHLKVLSVREAKGFVEVTAKGVKSGETYTRPMLYEDAGGVEVVEAPDQRSLVDPEAFFLRMEAHRIRHAHQFDPFFAVSVSQVQPLPHQMEAVYHHALAMPKLRFLIADDAGAGKTIMAGLIVEEMRRRGLVERVLVVAPGHLKYQWQREMKERFNTSFTLVDRGVVRSGWRENTWEQYPRVISSLDFMKQDDIKSVLARTRWDLVIVDEAHKMSAYRYESGGRERVSKTARYQLGEVLSENTEHLLFLSATPHKGDQDNFQLFLDLLRPGFFAKRELLEASVKRGDNPLFIRRLKEDMRTFDGAKLFLPRTVHTVRFPLTDEEMQLYNDVTRYIKRYYDRAKEKRHIAFAMVILQRRLTSSVAAILSSLQRRQKKLKGYLELPAKIQEQEEVYREVVNLEPEEIADMEEEDRERVERRLEEMTIAENIDDVRREIQELSGLIDKAEHLRSLEVESKLSKLKSEILSSLGERKLLIFTEHRDTLQYLHDRLRAWGYSVTLIHGGMHLDARIDAEHEFKHHAQIMVATEAAGEGINLQFCSYMVNYDIPWNPNRLEQRMGRIHRFGQDREVFIYNLVAEDTREGKVLLKLFDKVDAMQKALGSDRVFDIIGRLVPGGDLGDLLRQAVFDQRHINDIEAEIDAVSKADAEALLEDVFQNSLATRRIDYSGLKLESVRAAENRLVPEYIRDFFLRAMEHAGADVTVRDGRIQVRRVPGVLRRANNDPVFIKEYGKIRRAYSSVTFDKSVAQNDAKAEYLAPGHPMLESTIRYALREGSSDGDACAVFYDPRREPERVIWFAEAVIRDGANEVAGRRVFAVSHAADGTVESVNPAVLWDLRPAPDADMPDAERVSREAWEDAESFLTTELAFPYQDEIKEQRERNAEIKKRYGIRSLEYLISESTEKLLEYEERLAAGEDMALAIRNEETNKDRLEQRRDALRREIRHEVNVWAESLSILGAAVVRPMPKEPVYDEPPGGGPVNEPDPGDDASYSADPDARNDIERVGMEMAIAYEQDRGCDVVDVSKEKHGGFDLRSTRTDDRGVIVETRYIEVKARAQSGGLIISSNEWKRAKMIGEEYWLYVVTDAASGEPNLTPIQNPGSRFNEGETIHAIQFKISEAEWQSFS